MLLQSLQLQKVGKQQRLNELRNWTTGTAVASLAIHRGDAITLSNGSQTLTILHVANLQVALNDASPGVVTGGSCSPGRRPMPSRRS